jgi:hypothetical protein
VAAIREDGTDEAFSIMASAKEIPPPFAPIFSVSRVDHDFIDVCVDPLSSRLGVVTEVQFQAFVIATENDAVAHISFNQSFEWRQNNQSCTQYRLTDALPRTTYAIAARASTVADFGSISPPNNVTTRVLNVPPMFPPNIALLGRQELQSLGWTSGYSVSWRAPEGLYLKYLLRYDVINSGLSGNSTIIFAGQAIVLSIQRVMGKIRVRAVTFDGIGQYSDGVDTAALKPKSTPTDIIPIVISTVLVVVLAVLLVAVLATRYYRQYKRYQERQADISRRIPASVVAVLEKINGGKLNVPRDISPLSITFLDTLVEGKFGAVMKALLDEQHKTTDFGLARHELDIAESPGLGIWVRPGDFFPSSGLLGISWSAWGFLGQLWGFLGKFKLR